MSAKPYRICVFQIIRIRSGIKTLYKPRESSNNDKVDDAGKRMQKRYRPRDSSGSDKVDGAEERPRAKTLYKPRFLPRQPSASDKVQPFTIDGDDKPSEMTARRTAHLKRGFSSQISDTTTARMQKVFQV